MDDRRFIERFEVLEILGTGGMGTVFRARDPQLEREVAIKVLKHASEPARDELATRRTVNLRADTARDDLLHEARIMARLAHPNVVPVYEVGVAGRDVFVVMELVAGADLRSWLETGRAREQLAHVLAQAARGLEAAHERGIVHRDFKPENVLIGDDGRVRVADFGLSKLVSVPSSVMRVEERGGTPRYMAPELWRGEPATTKSDVFAFCTVLVEALGDSPLAARGIADDPAQRPDIAEIRRSLEALEAPAGRRSRVPIALAAAGVVSLGAVAAFALRSGGDGCEPAATPWRASDRAALLARLGSDSPLAHRVVDRLDALAGELATAQVAGCRAHGHGELSTTQLAARSSCFERRALQLAAFVHDQLAGAIDLPRADDRAEALRGAATCAVLDVPPLPADHRALAAIYDRLAAIDRTPAAKDRASALAAVEHDAAAAGDRELEAVAALALGVALRTDDEHVASDAALERAYKRAHENRDGELEALALVERSTTAGTTGDLPRARSYGQLALDLADRPDTRPRVRASVYAQLARADRQQGNYEDALKRAHAALDVIHASGDDMTFVQIAVQGELVSALTSLGETASAIDEGQRSLAFIRDHVGERSRQYGVALSMLAFPYRRLGKDDDAVRDAQAAVDVLSQVLPADAGQLVSARIELITCLENVGRDDDAIAVAKQLASVIDQPALRAMQLDMHANYAIAMFHVGRHDEAIRELELGVAQGASVLGAHHGNVLYFRGLLVGFRLELGQVEKAALDGDEVERGWNDRHDAADVRPVLYRSTAGAQLAIARGEPAKAEHMVREALAALDELHATDGDRRDALSHLVGALIAEHAWSDAQARQREVVALDDKLGLGDEARVVDELHEAEIADALGRHRDARELAVHAQEKLAHVRDQPSVARELDAFLAAHRR